MGRWFIGRSYTQDGDYNQAKIPIQQLNSNSGQAKIQSLIGSYNHYLAMLRDVTGLNEARDGATPDSYALVGLQKLAALSSNTATRHILDASCNSRWRFGNSYSPVMKCTHSPWTLSECALKVSAKG